MAQTAVEAARREEDALLRAGRELATRAGLQLLRQAEACTWVGVGGGGAKRGSPSAKGLFWGGWTGLSFKPEVPAVPVDTWKPFCWCWA